MRGGSSLGAAAAAKDVSVNVTNDTLIEAMMIFHCEGKEACVGLFPQYGRGSIIKKLVETCKQLKPGLFDLDITKAELYEMMGKELLKVKTLDLYDNQIVDVPPLAALVNLKELHLAVNQIVDVTPLATLVHLTDLRLDSNQIADVGPLAELVNLTELNLRENQIVDTSPLRSLPKSTKITGVSVCCRSCAIV